MIDLILAFYAQLTPAEQQAVAAAISGDLSRRRACVARTRKRNEAFAAFLAEHGLEANGSSYSVFCILCPAIGRTASRDSFLAAYRRWARTQRTVRRDA